MEDLSGVHLWLVLSKAAHAIESHARRSIADTGLGLTDFQVLEVLLHKGALPIRQIGERVLLTSGSLTTAIDRLEAMKLVERGSDRQDRRTRPVCLTPAGRKLIQGVFDHHAQVMERAASPLSPAERSAILRLLKKWGKGAAGI